MRAAAQCGASHAGWHGTQWRGGQCGASHAGWGGPRPWALCHCEVFVPGGFYCENGHAWDAPHWEAPPRGVLQGLVSQWGGHRHARKGPAAGLDPATFGFQLSPLTAER